MFQIFQMNYKLNNFLNFMFFIKFLKKNDLNIKQVNFKRILKD